MKYSMALKPIPWLALVSRSGFFLGVQALIALVFVAFGAGNPWQASIAWWPIVAFAANCASIFLLTNFFRAEGARYIDSIRFQRRSLKTDLIWLVVVCAIGLPLAGGVMTPLATALFGDSMAPVYMMFRPLPQWAYILAFAFPLTIAFAELPTYFGYAMPRIAAQLQPVGGKASGWIAWLLASFFLAGQHCFLPFIPDGRFLLYRAGMYLPFALFTGLVIKLRPSLLPYLMILHALMDISTMLVYLSI
jgi:hypothetical protein